MILIKGKYYHIKFIDFGTLFTRRMAYTGRGRQTEEGKLFYFRADVFGHFVKEKDISERVIESKELHSAP